jgi:hypothetical protein
MTAAERHDAALLDLTGRARRLIEAKAGDAESHARNALTDALKATPEGRPTLARVRRSPGYASALSRLDELAFSLVALCEAARVREYRRAYGAWPAALPPEVLRPRLDPAAPPSRLVERCRAALQHGTTLLIEIRGAVEPARRRLLPTLTQAGNRATPERAGADLLAAWRRGVEASTLRVAAASLNDSLILADRLAGRDVIAPERLLPDPSLPE